MGKDPAGNERNFKKLVQIDDFINYGFNRGSEGRSGNEWRSRIENLKGHDFWLHPIGVNKESRKISGQLSHDQFGGDEQVHFTIEYRNSSGKIKTKIERGVLDDIINVFDLPRQITQTIVQSLMQRISKSCEEKAFLKKKTNLESIL